MPAVGQNVVRTIFRTEGAQQTAAAFEKGATAASGYGDATAYAADVTSRMDAVAAQVAASLKAVAGSYGNAARDIDALAVAMSNQIKATESASVRLQQLAAAQAQVAVTAGDATGALHAEATAMHEATAASAMLERSQMVLAQRQVHTAYTAAAAEANFGKFYKGVYKLSSLGTPEILKAGTWGALAIGGAAYIGMKHYADFHKVVLQSVTEAGRKMSEIPYLEQGLVNTAKETGLALNDTAEIMYRVVSGTAAWHAGLGATKKEVINLTKEISALMVIGNIPAGKQMEQAARSVTALVNANLKDIGHSPLKAANMVVATSGAADMKPYELTSAIGRGVLQNAKIQGMSGLDVMSWIALLTSYGTTGSVAGTYVKSAIPQLFHPTAQGSLAMAMVGLKPTDLQDALDKGGMPAVVSLFNERMMKFDPYTNYPAFKGKEGRAAAIQKLQSWNANQFSSDLINRWSKGFDPTSAQDMKDLQNVKGLLMVKMFGGAKNLSALAAIMNNPDALEGIQYSISRKVASGEYQRAKEAALSQPSAQWNQMKQTLMSDLMEIGKTLTPVMLKLGHALTFIVDHLAKFKGAVIGLAFTFGAAATALAGIKIASLFEKLYPLIGGFANKRDAFMSKRFPGFQIGMGYRDARSAYQRNITKSMSHLGDESIVTGAIRPDILARSFGTVGVPGVSGMGGGIAGAHFGGGGGVGAVGGIGGGVYGGSYGGGMVAGAGPYAALLHNIQQSQSYQLHAFRNKIKEYEPLGKLSPASLTLLGSMVQKPYGFRAGFKSARAGFQVARERYGALKNYSKALYDAGGFIPPYPTDHLTFQQYQSMPHFARINYLKDLSNKRKAWNLRFKNVGDLRAKLSQEHMGGAPVKLGGKYASIYGVEGGEKLITGALSTGMKGLASGVLSGLAGFMTGPIGMMLMPMIIGSIIPHIGGIMGAISRWMSSNPSSFRAPIPNVMTSAEQRGTLVTNNAKITQNLKDAAKTGGFGPDSAKYFKTIGNKIKQNDRMLIDLGSMKENPVKYAQEHLASLDFAQQLMLGGKDFTKGGVFYNVNSPEFKRLPKKLQKLIKASGLTTTGKTKYYKGAVPAGLRSSMHTLRDYYKKLAAQERGVLTDPTLRSLVGTKGGQEMTTRLADLLVEGKVSGNMDKFGGILGAIKRGDYTRGSAGEKLRKVGEATLTYRKLHEMSVSERKLAESPNISEAEKKRLLRQAKMLQDRSDAVYNARTELGKKLNLTDESARNIAKQMAEQFKTVIEDAGMTQAGFEASLTKVLNPTALANAVNTTNSNGNARVSG